ncbi:MAG: type II secretion system F family protein [Candidatus Aenigmarchaeota archaeon]|nr:type II secretion system F family protein [Candidatus Aenigmarchaeota archaeon]
MPKKKKIVKKAKREDITFLKIISTRLFGNIIDEKLMKYFKNLKTPFDSAGLDMMFRTYLAMMFLIATVSFSLTLIITIPLFLLLKFTLAYSLLGAVIFSSLSTSLVFLYTYSYPTIRSNKRRDSIDTNLSFAINHMAAVAESGATPYAMFKVLSQFKEYGVLSKEADRIVRNIDLFGLDETASIKEVIQNTPSKEFKEFLEGILTTIQTGGNLNRFLRENSKEAMFNYRLSRQKYTEVISIYADFYTALLIATPLILIAILAILNTIGGSVFGLPIDFVIKLGVYVLIPLLSIIFLAFLEMTQPAM